MRRRLSIVGLLVAMAVAAGCSSGGGGDRPPVAKDDAPPPPVAPGRLVNVIGPWGGDEQNNFQRVIDRFEETTGFDIHYTAERNATAIESAARGTPKPDVVIVSQVGLLESLAKQGVLKPIENIVGKEVNDNYNPLWRERGSYDHLLYGVWFKASNKSVFWYNTKTFADLSLSPPGTWDDLKKAATTLAAAGITPISVGGADGWTLTDWFENVYIRTAGPDMYDKLATRQIVWTDPTVKKALSTLGEVFGKPQWLAGAPSGAVNTNFERSVTQVFENPPKTAMVYEAEFAAGVITSKTSAQLGADADIFNFPNIAGSRPAVIAAGDVALLLSDTPGAQKFIQFLATPEAAEPWARAGGGFASPNQKLSPQAYSDLTIREAAAALVNARVLRFDLSDLQPASFGATAGKGMYKYFQDFVMSGNVETVAAQLEASRDTAS